MPNIIFIAPLAAGKGTISEYLSKHLGYEHISTGDLFREIIKSGTSLGEEIKEIIAQGSLVDDDKTFQVILDGYPRNINQAKLLNKLELNNIIVIFLNLDYDVAKKRALGRIICPNCKKTYNIYFDNLKPKVDNICDECHSKLEKRIDDTEETFKKRFNIYLEETREVISYYKDMNLLKEVNANQDINDVIKDVLKIVNGDKYDKY